MTAAPPQGPHHRRRALAAAAVAAAALTAAHVASPRTPADVAHHGPPFPRGCVWRAAGDALEYEARSGWTRAVPPACTLAAVTEPWPAGGRDFAPLPSTTITCGRAACVLTHAWLPGGGPTLHSLSATPDAPLPPPTRLTRNLRLAPVNVTDGAAFGRAVAAAGARVARGTTLVLDYAFFKRPGAIGHWAELAAQTVAALVQVSEGEDVPIQIDRIMLLHAPRRALSPWVRAALAAAVRAAIHLPPLIVQVDAGAPASQLQAALETGDPGAPPCWLLLDRAIIPRDVFTGGGRVFHTPAAAEAWRRRFHEAAGVAVPPPVKRAAHHPPSILVLRKSSNRRIVNEAALVAALQAVGAVTTAEWTAATPVADQLTALAQADILISVHTSALAAVHLVRPGTAVVELLPRNWAWGGLDTSFRDAAAARGGAVRHAAWRARVPEESRPASLNDGARFGHLTPAQCLTEACVDAAAAADVVVDVGAVVAIARAAARGAPLPPWPEP